MKKYITSLKVWVLVALCLSPGVLPAQTNDAPNQGGGLLSRIKWTKGPAEANLGTHAQIKVPEGYLFAGAADTRKLVEAYGNPTSGAELGFLTSTAILGTNGEDWFVLFEFSDSGYVKDDDKDKLDADKMLNYFKKGNEEGNKLRKKMGVPPLNITGWELPPRYNAETHNLEWAIRTESEGGPGVNYNTRLLGRKGVMEVTLVIGAEKLAAAMPEYQSLLTGYSYKQGETYAEYRQGDKLAKYGLAGLVTAGAVAVGVKAGLFAWLIPFLKKFWVLLVAAVAGIVSFFKRLIHGGGRRSSTPE